MGSSFIASTHMNDDCSSRPSSGCGPGDDALQVADTDATADRVVDSHHAVAQLMQATGLFERRAIRDVLAVDMLRTAPLAVPVAVEAEVQPRAEVEARSPTAR